MGSWTTGSPRGADVTIRDSLLLRKAQDPLVAFHLYYVFMPQHPPEDYLIEPDLLGPFFDSMANSIYTVQTERVQADFPHFNEALQRYLELVRNWKATEIHVHPRIFRGEPWYREGVAE